MWMRKSAYPKIIMMKTHVILLLIAMLVLTGCGSLTQIQSGPTMTPPPPAGEAVDPPLDIPTITLVDQHGDDFDLASLDGTVSLIYFGYTSCPDICPLTLAEMSQAASILKDANVLANFIFVSVDPTRDTPQRLNQFLPQFNESFIGLSPGTEAQLTAITEAFDIYYEYEDVPESAAEYLVAHTSSTFLLNTQGQLVMIFPYRTPPYLIADEMMRLGSSTPDDRTE